MKQEKATTAAIDNETALTLELRDHLIRMGEICERLSAMQPDKLKYLPRCRRIWVSAICNEPLRDPEQRLPAFKLSGKWLDETGFHPDQYVQVVTLNNLLVICPESLVREV